MRQYNKRIRPSHPVNRKNVHNPNKHFDSNGPDVKIRGTAQTIYDKYQQLARDAHISGDRIAAENYLQHAEYYYRLNLSNRLVKPDYNARQLEQAEQTEQPDIILDHNDNNFVEQEDSNME